MYLMPEQAYQVMPLMTGVVPEDLRAKVHAKLIGLIEQKKWHVDTGLPGTTFLLDYLIETNEHEVLAKILAQTTYPSWGYQPDEQGGSAGVAVQDGYVEPPGRG
jgi:alpha-L-rhamnosidase